LDIGPTLSSTTYIKLHVIAAANGDLADNPTAKTLKKITPAMPAASTIQGHIHD